MLVVVVMGNTLPVRHKSKIDFTKFKAPNRSNSVLACPRGWCEGSGSIQTGNYEISKENLFLEAKGVLNSMPRVTLLHTDESLFQIVAVQRSKMLGFPDTIWVQVVDVDNTVSSIIFSRSNYGLWDAGVNLKRVRNLLTSLNRKLMADK